VRRVAMLEKHGRGAFLDDGRPDDTAARCERGAVIDRAWRRMARIDEIDRALAWRLAACLRGGRAQIEPHALADGARPDIDDLDRPLLGALAVMALMQRVEIAANSLAVFARDLVHRHRHVQIEFLADITDIERELD